MKIAVVVFSLTASLLGLVSPAMAVDGRHAVGLCIERGPACHWRVDPYGGIDIFVDGHWISCLNATTECVVLMKPTGHDQPGLPTMLSFGPAKVH